MILNIVPEKQLYSELRSLEPWPGKKHMGRPKDIEAWDMVDRLDPQGWKCRYCPKFHTSCSSVTRVKHYLARIPGGGIGPCPGVPRDVQERARHLLWAKAKAVPARYNGKNLNGMSTELLIQQMNGINQMQTQNHVNPTGSRQVQAVAVSNFGVHAHQYGENTGSYWTPEVQPGAVSHPVGEPNHQNESCAEATDPLISAEMIRELLEQDSSQNL
ncbi:hypothetical protein RGQ29_002501 [Quercus rubra]|uniref:BED-type domain-containing protein n=1 Tax=Quercus rubra TaxID=3512 RepID=A0AAN7E940_QUERU|nr:hypothetical protein RGQ29_002501 [Quercus rubra]KAK4566282.1 hypothetical protein RGQ29_002501 [Quercus rubra]